MNRKKNILFVLNGHKYVSYFFEPLAHYANKRGMEINLAMPEYGIHREDQWPLSEKKMVFTAVESIWDVRRLFSELLQPPFIPKNTSIVHAVTTHMIFLCLIRLNLRIERFDGLFIMHFIGLGRALSGDGVVASLIRFLLKWSWKFRRKSKIEYRCVYLNDDDLRVLKLIFGERGICYFKAPGAGVRKNRFQFQYQPLQDPIKLLFIGRLIKEKGIERFLDLVEDLLRFSDFEVECYVVGGFEDTKYEKYIKHIIYSRNLDGIVRLIGESDEPSTYYRASNYLIFPSYYGEGIPTVLIESQYCGTPCLASDIAGCREAIENRVTGYIVPTDSRDAWFQSFHALVEDANYESMCHRAHERARDYFGSDKIAKLTVDWAINELDNFRSRREEI